MTGLLMWTIFIAIALWALGVAARIPSSLRGRDRCSFCRAKLKPGKAAGRFADYCRRCGREQPWAEGDG